MKILFAFIFGLFCSLAVAAEDKATEKTHQTMQEGVGEGHPAESKRQQKKPQKDADSYKRDSSKRSSWPSNPTDKATSGKGPTGDSTHSDKSATE